LRLSTASCDLVQVAALAPSLAHTGAPAPWKLAGDQQPVLILAIVPAVIAAAGFRAIAEG